MSIEHYRSKKYVFLIEIIVTFDEIIEATGNTNKSDAIKMEVIDNLKKSRKLTDGTDPMIRRALSLNIEVNLLSSKERVDLIKKILNEFELNFSTKQNSTQQKLAPTKETVQQVSTPTTSTYPAETESSILGVYGSIGGTILGAALGGPFTLAGEFFKSNTLRNIGEGIMNTTANTGEILGDVASGSINTISGAIHNDEQQKSEGLHRIGHSGKRLGRGIANNIESTINHMVDMKDGLINNDSEKLGKSAKMLATTAVVGAAGIGIVDLAIDINSELMTDSNSLQHVDAHYVEGYERSDGTYVEGYVRDGDGNTNIHSSDGYLRGTSK